MPHVAQPVLAGDLRGGPAAGSGQGRGQLADRAGSAAAHVVGAQRPGPARGAVRADDRAERGRGGPRHIADVHEVPELGPVLEDPGGAPGLERGTEKRRHPGVGRVARHPRAVDVVVAQRHGLPAGRPGPRPGQVLLRELGGGVDVPRVHRRVLRHEIGGERVAAALAAGLEPARVQVGRLPGRRCRGQAVPRARVGALAVDHHRRSQHEPADARPAHGGQQDRRAEVIAACVLRRVVEVDAEADHRGQVADGADAAQRACDRGGVADVAVDELEAGIGAERRDAARVDAGEQRVQYPHLMPRGRKGHGHVGSDEAGAAGQQYAHEPMLRTVARGWQAAARALLSL